MAANTKPLTSFFGKGSELSIQSASTSSSMLSAPPLSNASLSLHPNHKNNVDSSAQVTSTFFTCLRNATESLPESVPLAIAADTLAQFSGDPSLGEDDEDTWQMVDQALNQIIGYGATVHEISTLIRRGEFGMDGLCCWLEKCVSTLRIEEVLLENKVNRLVEAMVKLCVFIIHYGMERSVNLTSRANTNGRPVIPSTPNRVVELPAATTQYLCPGYILTFPKGQTAWSSYPLAVHSVEKIPWSIASSGKDFILRSLEPPCSRVSPSTNINNLKPCTSCRMIHNHNIIMGIQHRALDGAKERTPRAYLSSAQMISSLERKDEIINTLKLKSLAASRMLGVRNQYIDGWKCLAIAVSRENIPRIKSLMAAAQHAGASVFSILDRIKKVAQRTYSPKGYEEADYQLGYLIYKIGGRAAAILLAAPLESLLLTHRKNIWRCHPLFPLPSFQLPPNSSQMS